MVPVDNFVSNYPNSHLLIKHVLMCNTLMAIRIEKNLMKSMIFNEKSDTVASVFIFCLPAPNCGQFTIVLLAAGALA